MTKILALFFVFFSPIYGTASTVANPFEEQVRIAILWALDRDYQTIANKGKNARQVTVAGKSATIMDIGDKKIVLTKIGRGPAKAATSALVALVAGDEPWYVFTVTPAAGICGQHNGKILIPSRIVDERGEGKFEVDRKDLGLEEDDDYQLCSVSEFVSSDSATRKLVEEQNCMIDMNSYWISEVAEAAGAKHIPIRVISDDAGNDAGGQFRNFAAEYSGQGADFLLKLIDKLPIPPNSALAHENILTELKNN
jgi:nucleoside phosphorylase